MKTGLKALAFGDQGIYNSSMDFSFFVNGVQSTIGFIIPMIILLGLLIFVHELGHFLVAKFFKVRVEVFSLGFGPKLFQFKRGDTVYCISAFPLGGYVKMFGDDPTVEIPDDLKAKSFLHKPVGQRIWIVLAGPLMNLFFAAFLFSGVAIVGERTLSPVVGDVEVNSEAYSIGFRSGDRILEIDGTPITKWNQAEDIINDSLDKTLNIKVKREIGESEKTLSVPISEKPNTNILSMKKIVGWVKGLQNSSMPPLIGVSNPNSFAAKMGLKTGDLIEKVNGVEVTTWRAFSRQLFEQNSGPLTLSVKRMARLNKDLEKDETLELKGELTRDLSTVQPSQVLSGGVFPTKEENPSTIPTEKTTFQILADLGFEKSETFVLQVSEDKPAAKAGLVAGDKILKINETEIDTFDALLNTVKGFKKDDPALAVTYLRNGELGTLNMTPELAQPDKDRGNYNNRYIIGISPIKSIAPPVTFIYKTANPITIIQKGIERSWFWTKATLISFVKLLTNEVSPKNLGGFISIGQAAQASWEHGISQFLRIMAIISINLFIINLFPIPILDGGHLLFFTIEALRGAPLSMRKLEIAQQIGLVLLLGLMGFALFNDVARLID